MRAERPRVEVALEPSTTSRLVERLDAGELDLAFVAAPFESPGSRSIAVASVPLLAALPEDHPLAGRTAVGLDELRDERWVLLPDQRAGLSAQIVAACRRAGFHPIVEGHADEFGAILALVAGGHGVTLVPAPSSSTTCPCGISPSASSSP